MRAVLAARRAAAGTGLRDTARPRRRSGTRRSRLHGACARRATGPIDLTDFFCDARTCSPVIGGVRVYSDHDHITAAYMNTLAPYLLRAVRALMATW